MDLWIRSQDRDRFVKNYAYIYLFNPCMEDEEYTIRHIYAYINESNQVFLGEYKTQERALEVLDEIQNHIVNIGKTYIKTNENGIPDGLFHYDSLYEMPEE